jgi:Transcription factor WhiB
VCASCPVVAQCREFALRAKVFGVAGGLTESEREAQRVQDKDQYLDSTEEYVTGRGARGQVDGPLVVRLLDLGWGLDEVANYLDCSVRSVSRAKTREIKARADREAAKAKSPRTGTVPSSPAGASNQKNPQRVQPLSPGMRAITQALSDGNWWDRDTLVQIGVDAELSDGADTSCGYYKHGKTVEAARERVTNALSAAARKSRLDQAGRGGSAMFRAASENARPVAGRVKAHAAA